MVDMVFEDGVFGKWGRYVKGIVVEGKWYVMVNVLCEGGRRGCGSVIGGVDGKEMSERLLWIVGGDG